MKKMKDERHTFCKSQQRAQIFETGDVNFRRFFL